MAADTPARFYLGVGLSSRASLADGLTLAAQMIEAARLDPARLGGIATIETRSAHPVLAGLARNFGLEVTGFAASLLESMTPRLANPSATVFRLTGCHGVAEAAALAAAGEAGRLVIAKTALGRVTMALASDGPVA
jgi:cobalamin biosynthesis protein CbiG